MIIFQDTAWKVLKTQWDKYNTISIETVNGYFSDTALFYDKLLFEQGIFKIAYDNPYNIPAYIKKIVTKYFKDLLKNGTIKKVV